MSHTNSAISDTETVAYSGSRSGDFLASFLEASNFGAKSGAETVNRPRGYLYNIEPLGDISCYKMFYTPEEPLVALYKQAVVVVF